MRKQGIKLIHQHSKLDEYNPKYMGNIEVSGGGMITGILDVLKDEKYYSWFPNSYGIKSDEARFILGQNKNGLINFFEFRFKDSQRIPIHIYALNKIGEGHYKGIGQYLDIPCKKILNEKCTIYQTFEKNFDEEKVKNLEFFFLDSLKKVPLKFVQKNLKIFNKDFEQGNFDKFELNFVEEFFPFKDHHSFWGKLDTIKSCL